MANVIQGSGGQDFKKDTKPVVQTMEELIQLAESLENTLSGVNKQIIAMGKNGQKSADKIAGRKSTGDNNNNKRVNSFNSLIQQLNQLLTANSKVVNNANKNTRSFIAKTAGMSNGLKLAAGILGGFTTALGILRAGLSDTVAKTQNLSANLRNMGQQETYMAYRMKEHADTTNRLNTEWQNFIMRASAGFATIVDVLIKPLTGILSLINKTVPDSNVYQQTSLSQAQGQAMQNLTGVGLNAYSSQQLSNVATNMAITQLQYNAGAGNEINWDDVANLSGSYANALKNGGTAGYYDLSNETLAGYAAQAKGLDIVNVEYSQKYLTELRAELAEYYNQVLSNQNLGALQNIQASLKKTGTVLEKMKNQLFSFDEVIQLNAFKYDENSDVKGQATVISNNTSGGGKGTDFKWPDLPMWPDYPNFIWPSVPQPPWVWLTVPQPEWVWSPILKPNWVWDTILKPDWVWNLIPQPSWLWNIIPRPSWVWDAIPKPSWLPIRINNPFEATEPVTNPVTITDLLKDPVTEPVTAPVTTPSTNTSPVTDFYIPKLTTPAENYFTYGQTRLNIDPNATVKTDGVTKFFEHVAELPNYVKEGVKQVIEEAPAVKQQWAAINPFTGEKFTDKSAAEFAFLGTALAVGGGVAIGSAPAWAASVSAAATAAANGVESALEWTGELIDKGINALSNLLGGEAQLSPLKISSFGFAEGGIATSRMDGISFAENGPEAAIPLNEEGLNFIASLAGRIGNDGQAGGNTYNTYLQPDVLITDSERTLNNLAKNLYERMEVMKKKGEI